MFCPADWRTMVCETLSSKKAAERHKAETWKRRKLGKSRRLKLYVNRTITKKIINYHLSTSLVWLPGINNTQRMLVFMCPRLRVSVWVWVQTAVALVIHPGSQGSQLLLPDAWEAAGVEWQQQLLSPIWLLIRELSPLSDTRHSPLSKQWFRLVKH